MKSLMFELETITPMFMAGANGETFELRPPAIKGLLRFWWRAYKWGKMSENGKLEALSEVEGQIFGTTSVPGQKSRFSIQVKAPESPKMLTKLPDHKEKTASRGREFFINVLDYLAYGTYTIQKGQGNLLDRGCLSDRQSFSVTIHFPVESFTFKEQTINLKEEVIRSFYFMSVFGGLGAKSRNGFGSIYVTNSDIFDSYELAYPFPDNRFFEECKTFNSNVPAFTGFSNGMKIFKLKQSYKTWDYCLAAIAKIYRNARGNLERKHQYEKRQYLGAPIVQHKSEMQRHAKPYFMRVMKTQQGFEGYILYLPSRYCDGFEKYRTDEARKHDDAFQKTCAQFNTLLEQNMEVVV